MSRAEEALPTLPTSSEEEHRSLAPPRSRRSPPAPSPEGDGAGVQSEATSSRAERREREGRLRWRSGEGATLLAAPVSSAAIEALFASATQHPLCCNCCRLRSWQAGNSKL